MNENGHPATLRAAQPGNRNAVKGGIYSPRMRAARADKIRVAAGGVSTLELVTTAVRAEVGRLEKLREALSQDIVLHGPSTRAGGWRGQWAQWSSVLGQLEKLEVSWATAEQTDECGLDDRSASDPTEGPLREELVSFLALRELLDLDLVHRGVSTRCGGERRQVALRVRVSRDLVRLADRIRAEARRARSAVAAMSRWDVAREIAFDPSQRPGDVIPAVKHLLTHRAPPLELPMEEQDDEPMSDKESEAFMSEVVVEVRERKARREIGPEAAAAADQRPVDAGETEVNLRCLGVLQRIGDGCDPRASARDRMEAVELRERYLAPADAEATWRREAMEEMVRWMMSGTEEADRDLLALLGVDYDSL